MRRVYVINYAGHDYSKAKKFGQVIYLTRGTINPIQVDRNLFEITKILKDSTPDDYVLLSGHHTLVAITISILITMHGKINTLVYSKNINDYVIREISVENIKNILKELKHEEEKN